MTLCTCVETQNAPTKLATQRVKESTHLIEIYQQVLLLDYPALETGLHDFTAYAQKIKTEPF